MKVIIKNQFIFYCVNNKMSDKVLVLIVLFIVIITISIVAYFMFNKKSGSTTPSGPVVNCVVGNWDAIGSCDTSGNRTRTRPIITQPLNGGAACPVLTDITLNDEVCFQDETCGKVVSSLGINSQADVQNKIYSQNANVDFWEGYNCNIFDRAVGIPNDKLCKYADDWLNNTNPSESLNNHRKVLRATTRAKTLIKCTGTLLDEGEFIGAGITSGNYFTITVTEVDSEVTNNNLRQNIGKKIRIWYGNDGYPLGLAFSKDWLYPQKFIDNNITLADLGSIEYDSSIEIRDREGGGNSYKLFLAFIPAGTAIPINNPREAVKWIVINKPSTLQGISFGAYAGTNLGYNYFKGNLTYGR
jgi:hypothetical protein